MVPVPIFVICSLSFSFTPILLAVLFLWLFLTLPTLVFYWVDFTQHIETVGAHTQQKV